MSIFQFSGPDFTKIQTGPIERFEAKNQVYVCCIVELGKKVSQVSNSKKL